MKTAVNDMNIPPFRDVRTRREGQADIGFVEQIVYILKVAVNQLPQVSDCSLLLCSFLTGSSCGKGEID